MQRLGYRPQTHPAQSAFLSRAGRQQRRQADVNDHHDTDIGMELFRAGDVPVVGASEHLQPRVDTFHRGVSRLRCAFVVPSGRGAPAVPGRR